MTEPELFKFSLWVEGNVHTMDEKLDLEKQTNAFLASLPRFLGLENRQDLRLLATSTELNYQNGKTRLKFTIETPIDFASLPTENRQKKAAPQS